MAYVEFPRSDGSPSNWPVDDPRFLKEPLDSNSTKAWRESLGQKVAEQLNLPRKYRASQCLSPVIQNSFRPQDEKLHLEGLS